MLHSKLVLFLLLSLVLALPVAAAGTSEPDPDPTIVETSTPTHLVSVGTSAGALSKAATDTFYLYGAPGTLEGQFQSPDGNADPQGWTGVDITDVPSHWQVDTFNAETLGGHGAGNHAAWVGRRPEQVSGWVSAPGYGDDWNDVLIWTSPPLVDTSVAQTVQLDFVFHYDTEPGYDLFTVEYDSAGFAPRSGGYYTGANPSGLALSLSGTDADVNGVFSAPGDSFRNHQLLDIAFTGNDYGGDNLDQIVILIRFRSDGGYSDQDGLYDSDGAVQVDDIRVSWDDGSGVIQSSFEDFEGVDPFNQGDWRRIQAPFAGDFSSVLPNLSDLDPCWENRSPVVNFLDRGQEIGNAASAANLPGTPTSTGGSLSPNWSYGYVGDHVLNYTGGVSHTPGDPRDGPANLFNEFWSPPIAFDLPGTADDGPDVSGLEFSFDSFEHLPLTNGLFWVWAARARDTQGIWTDWENNNFVFYSQTPQWTRSRVRIDPFFASIDIDRIQLSVGIWDLANVFGFAGSDGTPGFFVDNVQLRKFRIDGPGIRARQFKLGLGGFAPSGGTDVSTPAARDALDVPFDMGLDIRYPFAQAGIDPGDSIVVDVTADVENTTLADLALVWILERNPLFDDVRSAPARAEDRNVDTTSDPTRWFGETLGVQSTSNGIVVTDRYYFDLPDADLLYPGDVLRYYIRATDSDGRVTSLPRDISKFANGQGYPELFTMRALPSYQDSSGNHPRVLVVDYSKGAATSRQLELMLEQFGWKVGEDYDFYRLSDPASGVSDGIGSSGGHGANVDQIAGYRTILLDHAGLRTGLSDGSATGNNDTSDDFSLLNGWLALPGPRSVLHLGLESGGGGLNHSPAGLTYATTKLGITVAETTEGTEHYGVRYGNLTLGPEFDLYGGCRAPRERTTPMITFQLSNTKLGGVGIIRSMTTAVPPAFVGHWFVDTRTQMPIQPATVVNEWVDGLGDRKCAVSVFLSPGEGTGPAGHAGGLLPSSNLVRELLTYADGTLVFGVPTAAPQALTSSFAVAPTPFNPRTVVSLVIPQSGLTEVEVYDLRGRRVRTLLRGQLEAGVEQRLQWDGRDERGRSLASGVYFISVESPQFSQRRKVVLLK